MEQWPAERHAQILAATAPQQPPTYRGSPRVDEWLGLLRENSYAEMQKSKSKFLGGALTWARVADAAVTAIGKVMLGAADFERAVEAAEDAHTLAEQLRERDTHVTNLTAAMASSAIPPATSSALPAMAYAASFFCKS